MLLIQTPKGNSELSQTHKMQILAKIVNGFKFMLRFMMDIKGLFVWTLGSVIRVIQLIWTLEKIICFVPFNQLDHESLDPGYKNTKTQVTNIRNL